MHDPVIYPGEQYGIDPQQSSSNARSVVATLKQAGFKAYIVGGGIRDLLLGQHPKDFDIATDARPEQAEKLFRRARIIGRRFRIVHVYCGRELIEIATFRGHHDDLGADSNKAAHAQHNEAGQLLRDNVYGSMEDDAIRRDFTINALFYDPEANQIIDYTDAMADIKAGKIQLIGEPERRYREDPVRMLRAARFAAKLNFEVAAETAAPIYELGYLLDGIPAARLFDEVLKLLLSGNGKITFQVLRQFQLFEHLFPATAAVLDDRAETFLNLALENSDNRLRQGKSVTPAFLFATLLWPALQAQLAQHSDTTKSGIPELLDAAHQVISQQIQITTIPRRFSIPMREIWTMQQRLPQRAGRRAERLVQHPRFRAAYDFLLLREASGEDMNGLGQWWTDYQAATEDARETMSRQTPGPKKRRRRSRKPRKKPAADS